MDSQQWKVGRWYVLTQDNKLSDGITQQSIAPKAMDVLMLLIDNAGNTVSREQLLSALWPGRYGADDALSRTVSELRKALADGSDERYIQTIPKRGYQLIAEVTECSIAATTTRQGKRTPFGPFRRLWVAVFVLMLLLLAGWWLSPQGWLSKGDSVDRVSLPKLDREAQLHYLLGEQRLAGLRPDQLVLAQQHFERVIAAYPGHYLAKINLALTIIYQLNWGQLDEEIGFQRALGLLNEARASGVERALLDFTYAFLYSPKAITFRYTDIEKATRYYQAALEKSPDDPRILSFYAAYTFAGGRIDDAIAIARRATELDPTSSHIKARLAYLYFAKGDLQAASGLARKIRDLFPNSADGYYTAIHPLLFRAQPSREHYLQALSFAQRCLQLNPYVSDCWGGLMEIAAASGDANASADVLANMLSYTPALRTEMRLLSHIAEGHYDQAHELLNSVNVNELLPAFTAPARLFIAAQGVRQGAPVTAAAQQLANDRSGPRATLYQLLLSDKSLSSAVAQQKLTRLLKQQQQAPPSNKNTLIMAEILALLGNRDAAFEQLARLADASFPSNYFWGFYRPEQSPFLTDLKGDPRWSQWLAKLADAREPLRQELQRVLAGL